MGTWTSRSDYGPEPAGKRSSSSLRSDLGEPPPEREALNLTPYQFYNGRQVPGGINPIMFKAVDQLDVIFQKYGYDPQPAGDLWCYARRKIRDGSVWSSHSWATSLDCAATLNPFSTSFSSNMSPPMIAEVEALKTSSGVRVFHWGGRWSTADPMHIGLNLYVAEAKEYNEGTPMTQNELAEARENTWLNINADFRAFTGRYLSLDESHAWRSSLWANSDPLTLKSLIDFRAAFLAQLSNGAITAKW